MIISKGIKLYNIEEIVLYLVRNLINLPLEKAYNAIDDALGVIAPFCDLDGVYIYAIDWDKEVLKLQNIWHKNRTSPADEPCTQIPFSYMPVQVIDGIKKGEPYIPGENDFNTCPEGNRKKVIRIIPLKACDCVLGVCVLCQTASGKKFVKRRLSVMNIFCAMLTNILLRMDYEKNITEKNESMQLLLDSTNDGIGMIDKAGNILNVNKNFACRFSKAPKEIIGFNIEDLLPQSVYGDLFEQRLKKINSVFHTRRPYVFEDTRDGLWFINRSYPIFKDGQVIAAALFSSDISALKRLQVRGKELLVLKTQAEELKKREREYLEILDSSTEGNYVVDFIKGTTQYSEKWKKRLGLENAPPESLLDMLHERMEPEEVEENLKIRYDVETRRDPAINRVIKVKDSDNRTIWIKVQGKFFYDDEGRLIKTYGTFFDVTELKEMELELRSQKEEVVEKNRILTEFFTNVSHEFRTPISILLMKLEQMDRLIKPDTEDYRDIRKTMEAMRQYTFRLTKLVGNLLDITKIDAGFESANFRKDDVVRLVRELVDSAVFYAGKRGIGLEFISDTEENYIPVDRDKVERVLLNLLSNAMKHTKRGGRIKVTMRNRKNKVAIEVKDNGEGIPKHKLEAIFERFRQANTSLTRSAEGCGIGLSLAKGLTELLGGQISVKSKPGKGSAFCAELPVPKTADAAGSILADGMPVKVKAEIEFSDINFPAG
jgi:PAS domain S-box-containing protein